MRNLLIITLVLFLSVFSLMGKGGVSAPARSYSPPAAPRVAPPAARPAAPAPVVRPAPAMPSRPSAVTPPPPPTPRPLIYPSFASVTPRPSTNYFSSNYQSSNGVFDSPWFWLYMINNNNHSQPSSNLGVPWRNDDLKPAVRRPVSVDDSETNESEVSGETFLIGGAIAVIALLAIAGIVMMKS